HRGGEEPGAPKQGSGLLSGLLRYRRCGRKRTVRYTGNQHDVLRYWCHRGRLNNGEPRYIAFGGIPVEDSIGKHVLEAVQSVAVDWRMESNRECRMRFGGSPPRLGGRSVRGPESTKTV